MELKGKIRKWGNSFGVLLPKKALHSENLQEDDTVAIELRKINSLEKIFALCHFKKPTPQLIKEIRKGYD